MDLRIEIKDENQDIMRQIVIYQDGSDSEGCQQIIEFIQTHFTIDESEWANLPAEYRPQ